jgi:hypothetical protein
MTIWNRVEKADQREKAMMRIGLVAALAAGLVITAPASALAAKTKHPSATRARVQRTPQWAAKCAFTCRQYGWPSWLLSFPPR